MHATERYSTRSCSSGRIGWQDGCSGRSRSGASVAGKKLRAPAPCDVHRVRECGVENDESRARDEVREDHPEPVVEPVVEMQVLDEHWNEFQVTAVKPASTCWIQLQTHIIIIYDIVVS